jgi:hypothetical protein
MGIKLKESTTPESSVVQQFFRFAGLLYSVRPVHSISTHSTEIWQRTVSPAASYEPYFETLLRPTHTSRKLHAWPCLLSCCDFYGYERLINFTETVDTMLTWKYKLKIWVEFRILSHTSKRLTPESGRRFFANSERSKLNESPLCTF